MERVLESGFRMPLDFCSIVDRPKGSLHERSGGQLMSGSGLMSPNSLRTTRAVS